MHENLIVATRLHTGYETNLIDPVKVENWCTDVLGYCDILILGVDQRYYDSLKIIFPKFGERLQVLDIHPWVSVTHPLNMIVERALSLQANKILFQSFETTVKDEDIVKLQQYFDKNTLVVGAKLHPRRNLKKGKQPLNGWNTPWNTLALWDLQKLGLTGFLTVSGGNIGHLDGGVEEGAVISLLQYLKGDTMQAKLIDLPTAHWNTNWECDLHTKYHERKMASKTERALKQLQALNITAGKVIVL